MIKVKYMYLGDYVGSGSYFGQCFACGRQFMSMAERIAVIGGVKHCLKCAGQAIDAAQVAA